MLALWFARAFAKRWSIGFLMRWSTGTILSRSSFSPSRTRVGGRVTGSVASSAPTLRSTGRAGTCLLVCELQRGAPVTLHVSHRKQWPAYHHEMSSSLITVDSRIQGGVPVFAGTRVPVKNLFDYLETGESLDQFLDDFPSVARDVAVAVLEQAREAVTPHAHSA